MRKELPKLKDFEPSVIAKSHTNRLILGAVTVLVLCGFLMLYSVSYANGIYSYGDGYYFIKTQVKWGVLGFILMIAISYFPYELMHRLAWPFFGMSYLMLVLTLAMPPVNNSRRWIFIGSTSFQPSELMKFAIIFIFSEIISINYEKLKDWKYGLIPFGVILGAVAIVMLLQPHFSGLVIILLIGAVMMIIGGTRVKHLFIAGGVAVGLVAPIILTSEKYSYIIKRLFTKFEGGDSSSDNYQTYQSLIAIGSGGPFGLGLGNSRQKQLYVPYAQNDFIFSIIAEEVGFLGCLLILILFAMFVLLGFGEAMKCTDKFGALLIVGVSTQIAIQVLLNIAVVSDMIPNTGVALPFFSQGGTALLVDLCEVGVILSVARYSKLRESGAKYKK